MGFLAGGTAFVQQAAGAMAFLMVVGWGMLLAGLVRLGQKPFRCLSGIVHGVDLLGRERSC
jgi:hypothetical protein